ncbi:pentapeptide repeat-containing protein [Streptomyces synnematoformans]|uniref:Pentapeptide repeat-containing protein n=1 Tax=Streptomyces synnematoformans TaxID=415721 RepID=A0ABP5J2G2_9ACTN
MEGNGEGRTSEAPRRQGLDWARRVELASVLIASLVAAVGLWYSSAQVREELQISKEGQITDRYNAAVTNLGSDTMEVRLGGVYALQRIMQDSPRDHPGIANVLTTYVRAHADRPPQKGAPIAADIQAALSVIATRDPAHDDYFVPDLRAARLPGVDLGHRVPYPELRPFDPDDYRPARLEDAILTDADLTRATLTRARLHHANLTGADLTGANLDAADLSRAFLPQTDLSDAYLVGADLSGASLGGADMAETQLFKANLTGARLGGANLKGANLKGANLQQASFRDAHLQDAFLANTNMKDADLTGADLTGADVAGADLTGASVTADQLTAAHVSSTTTLPSRIADHPDVRARIADYEGP